MRGTKDFKKVKAKIKELPQAKQEIANRLLSKAVFMDAELEKLQKSLEENGWTEKYQNGANQFGIKKSSEGEIYNTLIKNYTTTMGKINDLFPKEDANVDELNEWLN